MVETVHMVRPNHMNAAGRLFGGMLMQWLDEVAGMVAKRHTRSNVITASVDNLHFIHGAYQGEMVVIIGKVTYVGNSSMEVRVDTYVEHLEDGMRHPINRAYFTMVALDENDKPKRVPRLILETEAEKTEWEAAENARICGRGEREKDSEDPAKWGLRMIKLLTSVLNFCSISVKYLQCVDSTEREVRIWERLLAKGLRLMMFCSFLRIQK